MYLGGTWTMDLPSTSSTSRTSSTRTLCSVMIRGQVTQIREQSVWIWGSRPAIHRQTHSTLQREGNEGHVRSVTSPTAHLNTFQTDCNGTNPCLGCRFWLQVSSAAPLGRQQSLSSVQSRAPTASFPHLLYQLTLLQLNYIVTSSRVILTAANPVRVRCVSALETTVLAS